MSTGIAVVGLVGGIGSGKTAVAGMFADLGVPVLDLDGVARSLTRPGEPGVHAVLAVFGEGLLTADGRLDRARLARLVFDDEQAMKKLTGALHPLIWAEADRWLATQNCPYALIEAVVLLESGAAKRVDAIIAVQSDLELRRQRVIARGHPDPAMFDDIVRQQCSDAERTRSADFVIQNDGDLAHLRQSVMSVHSHLLRRFASRHSVDIAATGE